MRFYVGLTITAALICVGGATLAAEGGPPPGAGFGLGTGPIRDDVPRIRLYDKTPGIVEGPETELDPAEPTLDIYLPEAGRETGAGVLVLPGGGYQILTLPGEGPAPARFFRSNNVAAFVLRYRHGPRYHYPTTLLDAQRALRLIKAHAREYRVDPQRIGVLGASAGGHLAAMLATLHGGRLLPAPPYVPDSIDAQSARPAFTLLLYPVIDLTEDAVTHRGSRKNLTQDDTSLYGALSPQMHVGSDTPPVFLVHGTNDGLVPVKNSLLFYEAALKAGIPAEMHILDNGPHGFGMAAAMNDETVKEWPTQALRFMARHGMMAPAGPPPQVLPAGIRGGSEVVPETGVEIRKYVFSETGEELPYSVFVSSKVKKGQKAPLIIALRGYTGTTLTFVRGTAVDLAEAGGYILVGAIGYNNRAGFGVQAAPRPTATPGTATAAPATAAAVAERPQPPWVGGTKETDPAKVTQYSEKDVMNVLALVRREFNIDDRRIYLMGHSQGGGGARHLAEKYPDTWAAVALLAPALFNVQVTTESKIRKVPLLLAVGDKDSLITSSQAFSEQLKGLGIRHEYIEKPGLDHGTIIMGAMPDVFRFFPKHVKPAR